MWDKNLSKIVQLSDNIIFRVIDVVFDGLMESLTGLLIGYGMGMPSIFFSSFSLNAFR